MTIETAIQILQAQANWYKNQRNKFPSISEICEASTFVAAELTEAARNKYILEIVKAQYEEEKRLMFKYEGKQNGFKYSHRKSALWDLLKKIENTKA